MYLLEIIRAMGEQIIKLKERISDLEAENAGLRTGYQAFEDVNARLKKKIEGVDKSEKQLLGMLREYFRVERQDD